MNAKPNPIPVLCDCCRAQGHAGEEDFAHLRDLLDFEPVPRRKTRVDGWTPEVQRFFIIALVATGSDRQAARAVNKAAFGVEQLKNAEGNESFLRAHARALEIHAVDNTHRLAEGVRAVTGQAASWRAPKPAWSGAASRQQQPPRGPVPEEEPELTEEEREERHLKVLESIFDKFILKVQAERQARLDGYIVAADHYCRQLTVIEVLLDLGGGWDFQQAIEERCGVHLVDIAATPLSMLFDEVRREKWAELGEPRRPPPPSHDELVERDGFYMAKGEMFTGTGDIKDFYQWQRDLAEKHRQAAEAQVAWEAEACRDYERRRESGAAS
jgi:hypothetical protein